MSNITMDVSAMSLQQQVKYVRMQLQLSQEELARLMGVSYATVSRLEREKCKPQLATLGKFYSFCQRSGVELVTRNNEEFSGGYQEWLLHMV